MTKKLTHLRNVAIVAHVDHGKTTLVDALFKQGGLFRDNQNVEDRVMDSNDQERERGITILAKATSVQFGETRFQIVDTPGHADFGGEVERTLRMVDGVLLLVDAAEGPLPQTRFVLRKALDLGHPIVLAINKIDRQDARVEEVLNEVYDLLIDLDVDEEQLEFPVLYTNAREGTATTDIAIPGEDLRPLVDALEATIPPPDDLTDQPFSMQINQLGYDDYVGRLAVGRVLSGSIKINAQLLHNTEEKPLASRVTGIFSFQGVQRLPKEVASCGDIVALSGFPNVGIGDTLCDPSEPTRYPPIQVDEPTVTMIFQVNNGPLAGQSGGKYLTSRHLRERLMREAYTNVSIRIEDGESPEQFQVFGRGELQLSVLIESMRREKYEFCVRNPQVVTRDGESGKEEPTERVVIDVAAEHVGAISQLLGNRRAQLIDQRQEGSRIRVEYIVPTRGLFGIRNTMMTATRGTAIMHHVFEDWIPWTGPIPRRKSGAMVADRRGTARPYALFKMQPRGTLFISGGADVYEGMIVGEHIRENDLNVNVVREKKLTNVRASGKDDAVVLSPPPKMGIEETLEWLRDDEMVEVTPDCIRLRKIVLPANQRSVKYEPT